MRLVVDPCPFEASEHLRRALGVSRVMADVLVRRGLDDPEEARAFLALRGPQHDPLDLGDMAAACDVIEAAIADGRKIVVHGDYDVDGICATAVATAVIAGARRRRSSRSCRAGSTRATASRSRPSSASRPTAAACW